jgi:AcrR family transcriptional regulator
MPKVVDFEQKKREIAHKALYVFAFEGYHPTTMAQIAEMCDIGRSTIYEYFRNKDEIFAFTLNQSFDAVALDFEDLHSRPHEDTVESIFLIIRRVLTDLYQDKRVLLVLLEHTLRIMREDQEVGEKLKVRATEILGKFASLLEEGIRQGEIRPVDSRAMAATLGSLIEAAVFQISIDAGVSLDVVLDSVRSLIGGLRTSAGSGSDR